MTEQERPVDYEVNDVAEEMYPGLGQTNYKVQVDNNMEAARDGNRTATQFSQQTVAAIIQQQRESYEDVRLQNQQLFANIMTQNQQLFAASYDHLRTTNAGVVTQTQRTAVDAGILSNKVLDKDTTDVTSEAVGAKVAQSVAPVIDNAIKAAVANRTSSSSDAQGIVALNASVAASLSEMAAVMQQAMTAMNSAVMALQAAKD